MRIRRSHLLILPIALAAACSTVEPAVVAPVPASTSQRSDGKIAAPIRQTLAQTRDELYFGRRMADGRVVSDEAWSAFVASVVTPRFPGGFTIMDAHGHWRNADGALITEPTKILIVVHSGRSEEDRALEEIISAYKRQFAQESVMRVTTTAAVEF